MNAIFRKRVNAERNAERSRYFVRVSVLVPIHEVIEVEADCVDSACKLAISAFVAGVKDRVPDMDKRSPAFVAGAFKLNGMNADPLHVPARYSAEVVLDRRAFK